MWQFKEHEIKECRDMSMFQEEIEEMDHSWNIVGFFFLSVSFFFVEEKRMKLAKVFN